VKDPASAFRALAGTAIVLTTVGCASLAARAPMVTAGMSSAAAANGVDPAVLGRGRALYVGSCARCHVPVEVTSRTRQQWDEILPRMADKAGLEPVEEEEVAAYIDAVIDVAEP